MPRASPFAWIVIISVFSMGCASRPTRKTFDICPPNPPSGRPLPAITGQQIPNGTGRITAEVRDLDGERVHVTAFLDTRGSSGNDSGAVNFVGVNAGTHRLLFRSFGLGARDTTVALPEGSDLHLIVPLSTDGGVQGCGTYVILKPWWHFW